VAPRTVLNLIGDAVLVIRRIPRTERLRVGFGPRDAVHLARLTGGRARRRNEMDRRNLRRLIGLIDRMLPGGPNCYRRVLLEVSTDEAAARETVTMGLRASGGPRSGHAWLGDGVVSDRGDRAGYDAIVSI